MNPAFWLGRRVFLTGHTGFKGAWLALWLGRAGAAVHGYSLAPPSEPSLYTAAGVQTALVRAQTGDVRDLRELSAALSESGAEVIFHMAAQSLVRRGYAEPVETFSTNVVGTVNLLEAARAAPRVRAVVVATSDKCYANTRPGAAFLEDDPLGGSDPYSASKAAAEIAVAAWRESFLARSSPPVFLATVRAGNVIGGGDWATDRLITDLVAAFTHGEAARIRNPRATRPWQHVLDALAGYLAVGEALVERGAEAARAWNIGPDPASVADVASIADRVARAWGKGARWEADQGSHPPEAPALQLDASAARERLGWQPQLDLEETVRWTAEWYRQYAAEPSGARAQCEAQLARYAERAPA